MKVEPTTVEFEASDGPRENLYGSPPCIHCGKLIGYHWQTADGKIWCTREVADSETGAKHGDV